jgi:hypothetical protein
MCIAKTIRRSTFGVAVMALLVPTLGWTGTAGPVTITRLTIYMAAEHPGAIITISPATSSVNNSCSYTGNDDVWIEFSAPGSPNGRDLYATALAAFTTGQQITVATVGCAGPANSVPSISSLSIP